MANLIFVVSRSRQKRHLYGYLKQIYADQSRDVVLDRRKGEPRRSRMLVPPRVERRYTERRRCDINLALHSWGCALVWRPSTRTA